MKVRKKLFVVVGLLFAIILVATALLFMPRKNAHRSFAATYNTAGLGMGIDVVNAKEVNEFKTTYQIFDTNKIENLSAGQVTLNRSVSKAISTTDVEKVAKELGVDVNTSAGVEFPLGAVGKSLSLNSSLKYDKYTYKYYYLLDHKVERYQRYLFNSNEQSTYADCYTPKFLQDLSNLDGGILSYEDFFRRYGTHVVGKAIFGGRLNAAYTVATNEVAFQSSVEASMKDAASAGFTDDLKMRMTNAIGAKLGMSIAQSDIETEFNVRAWGGSAVMGNSLQGFNTGYEHWCNSFNNDSQSVIIDYPQEGLVPIWRLLPSDYAHLSSAIEGKYQNYYNKYADELLAPFRLLKLADNYTGSGTADDPYLIRRADDLQKIPEKGMDRHYALANDVTLSGTRWNPIGGVEKTNSFRGTLNGRGYKICNLTEIVTYKNKEDEKPINGKDRRIYFGLFGDIGSGATVKNLSFENVNVSIQGPSVNNSGTRVVMGILAATFYGRAQNINVLSGSFSYDRCTNGSSIVGGIAGLARNATFVNCSNSAKLLSGRYSSYVGGICGYASISTFNDCNNRGSLQANCTFAGGYASCGGIVGMSGKNLANTYNNCSNSGALKARAYKDWACSGTTTAAICAKSNGPDLDY